jgi:hypothetical protein
MSIVHVRAALEGALAAMSSPLATAWENREPPTVNNATPYQRANLLTATPENLEMSSAWTERGFMQVTLCYPQGAGAGDAMSRAQAIRDAFPRGRTLTESGVTVLISGTPAIMPPLNEGDRYVVPVRVPFRANIQA